MIPRLRDQRGSGDADEAFAARVVSAKRVHEVDAFMEDRVLASMQRTRGKRRRGLHPLVAFVAVLLVIGVASASWASVRRFVEHVERAIVGIATHHEPKPRARAASTPVSAAPIPAPIVTPLPVPATPAPPPKGEVVAARPRHEHAPVPAPVVVPPMEPTERTSSEGAFLASEAFRALRNRHDAESTLRFIAEYEKQNPAGPLAEEMAALRIEALTALGDEGDADAARAYLRRYPQGRFVKAAQRVLVDE